MAFSKTSRSPSLAEDPWESENEKTAIDFGMIQDKVPGKYCSGGGQWDGGHRFPEGSKGLTPPRMFLPATWVEIIVVCRLLWPSLSWMVRIPYPLSRRGVAKL